MLHKVFVYGTGEATQWSRAPTALSEGLIVHRPSSPNSLQLGDLMAALFLPSGLPLLSCFLLPPCKFQGSNSRRQAWWQEPLPTEQSQLPCFSTFEIRSCSITQGWPQTNGNPPASACQAHKRAIILEFSRFHSDCIQTPHCACRCLASLLQSKTIPLFSLMTSTLTVLLKWLSFSLSCV